MDLVFERKFTEVHQAITTLVDVIKTNKKKD